MVSKIIEFFFILFKNSTKLDCEKIIMSQKKIRYSAYVIVIFLTFVLLIISIGSLFINDLFVRKQNFLIVNILIIFIVLINLILIFLVVKENLCNYVLIYKDCIKVVQKANSVIIKNEEIINVVQKKININELDSLLIVLTNNQKYNINVKMFSQKDIDYLILLLEMYINSTTDEVMDNDINNIGNTSKKIIQEIVCGSLELMLLYEIIAVILFLPCRFIIYYFNINESIPKALPSIADIFLFLLYIITLKFHRQFANYLTMLGISIKVKILAFIFLFLIFILVGIIFNI